MHCLIATLAVTLFAAQDVRALNGPLDECGLHARQRAGPDDPVRLSDMPRHPAVPGAVGKVGPSLDDLAQRSYLAGTLQNSPDNLVHWIQHPQQIHPGTAMPEMGVTSADAARIAAFLQTTSELVLSVSLLVHHDIANAGSARATEPDAASAPGFVVRTDA